MTVTISGDTGIDKVQDASIVLADLASEVYQTGTWTPVVQGTATAGTGTYTIQTGKYTKIGNVVIFQCYVAWSAHTGTGSIRVFGLPYTSLSGSTNYGSAFGESDSIAMTAGYYMTFELPPANTCINVMQCPTGGGTALSVPVDGSGYLVISGHYFTS